MGNLTVENKNYLLKSGFTRKEIDIFDSCSINICDDKYWVKFIKNRKKLFKRICSSGCKYSDYKEMINTPPYFLVKK